MGAPYKIRQQQGDWVDMGAQPVQGSMPTQQAQPDQTQSWLEHDPDDNLLEAGAKGVGRFAKGLFYDTPKAIWHSTDAPRDLDEQITEATGLDAPGVHITGRPALAMRRLLVDPQMSASDKADEYQGLADQQRQSGNSDAADNFWTGSQHKANAWRIGSRIPFLGPIAANFADQATGGYDAQGNPQDRDITGATAELLGYSLAPKLVEKGVKAGYRATVGKSLATRPVPDTGGMTTGDVYRNLRDQGVNMSLDQATRGPVARYTADVSSNTPGGAGRMAKFRSKQASQLSTAMSGMLDKVDPTGAGSNIADQGGLIQRALDTAQDVAHTNASDAFKNNLSQLFDYSTADTGDIVTQAQQMKQRLLTGEIKSLQPQKAMDILDEISDAYGPQHGNKSMFDSVFRDRSRLMKSQFTDANVAGEGEGVMRQMAGVMRGSLEKAATKAGKLPEFNNAMEGWQEYIDQFGDKRSPLVQAMNEPDVSRVIDKFIGNRGSYRAIQMLKQVAPEFVNVLKREFVRRLYDTKDTGVRENFGNMQNRLLSYNEPFVKELFTPEELQQLRALSAGAKSIYADVNPPGSGRYAGQTMNTMAGVGGLGTAMYGATSHNPLLAAAGTAVAGAAPVISNIASRVLTSEPISDFFMGYKKPGIQPVVPVGNQRNQGAAAPPGATTIPSPFQRTGQGLRNPARTGARSSSQAGFATGDMMTGGIMGILDRIIGDSAKPSPESLKGPRTTEPKLLDIANKYNEGRGAGKIEKTDYVSTDPRAAQIADAYESAKHNPSDPEVQKSYQALGNEIRAQYDHATKAGIKFEPWEKEGQPYKNSAEMMKDVRDNGHLYFFRGGEMPADHPLAVTDADGMTLNDKLRAVHDLFGHAMEGNQFGPRGEENAWLAHQQMFSDEAKPALMSETKGQNSWVNSGKHIRDAQAPPAPADRPFAEQKAALLPKELQTREIPKSYMEAVHYSDTPELSELDPSKYGQNRINEKNGREVSRPDLTRKNAFPQYWQDETYLGKDSDTFRQRGGERFGERKYRYNAKLDAAKYYDMQRDPEKIIDQARKQIITENQAATGAKIVPSEAEVQAKAIQMLKQKGYSGRIGENDLIASWDKVPVEQDIIPPRYDVLLKSEERASLKTEYRQKQFVKTLETLPDVHEWADVAKAGEAGRQWYARSNKAFDSLMEAAPDYFQEGDRQKFADFTAALSPQQAVTENIREALSTWKKWVDDGRPTDSKVLDKMLSRRLTMAGAKVSNAIKALRGEEMWPSIEKSQYFKVPSFARNLRGMMDAVTNDSWMGVFSGINDPGNMGKPSYYHAVSTMTRMAAKKLGWNPAEAQAAIWTFTRTLSEQSGWSGPKARYQPADVVPLMDDVTTKSMSDDFADIMSHDEETRSLLKKLGVDLGSLDKKLEEIGHGKITYGTASATGDSFGKLADRIEAARAAREAGRPKIKDENQGDFSFDFGQNEPGARFKRRER